MNRLCFAIATWAMLGLSACSAVNGPGATRASAAPASATAQAAPEPTKKPWDYHSYPFGE